MAAVAGDGIVRILKDGCEGRTKKEVCCQPHGYCCAIGAPPALVRACSLGLVLGKVASMAQQYPCGW